MISPSQNTGVEMPKSAKPIAKRSANERRRTAESTPTATPEDSQSTVAPAISSSVRGARAGAGDLTDAPEAKVKPRPGQPYWSPAKKCHENLPNCFHHGRSS